MIGTTARTLWGRKRFQATTYGQLCGSLAVACALVALVVVGLGSAAAAGPPTLVVSGLTVEPGQVRFTLTAHDAGALDAGAVAVRSGPMTLATAAVPDGLAGSTSTLDISVGQSLRIVQPVTFASLSTVDVPPLRGIPSWLAYVFAVLVFGALVAIVLIFAWPRELPIRRIRQVTLFGPGRSRQRPRLDAGSVPTAIARTALAATASVVRSRGLESRIALSLERAGIRLQPHEWVLLRALVTIGGGVALFVALGPAGAVLGLVLGFVATMLYQTSRVDRRSSRFADQLPDALQLVIGSLKSGFALPQALDALISEAPEPVRAEFGRALAEHRLGADLPDALERVAQRTGSDDLVWAVMGIRIQREVGGNLAEVLQTTVDTMRERSRLRRHVRALSAEGRLSAWVLIALPLGLGLFMFVFRRSYMTPLMTDPTGITMLVGGSLLFVLGIVWLLRVIKVEA